MSVVHLGDHAGDDHAREELAAIGAERLRRLEQRGVDAARGVGDDQHLLEKRADEDDGDLGRVVDAEHRHRQRAERGRRQVTEEFDERLLARATAGSAPHRIPSGTPITDDSKKPQKMTVTLCHKLSCSQGSEAAPGRVVKPVTSAVSHLVRRGQEHRVLRHTRGRLAAPGQHDRFSVVERLDARLSSPGASQLDVTPVRDLRPSDARRRGRN